MELFLGFIVGVVLTLWACCTADAFEKQITERKVEKSVNHPDYYNLDGRKECIVEMEETYGARAVYNFCICNVYKYRYRKNDKGNCEADIAKANWYEKYSLQVAERMRKEIE